MIFNTTTVQGDGGDLSTIQVPGSYYDPESGYTMAEMLTELSNTLDISQISYAPCADLLGNAIYEYGNGSTLSAADLLNLLMACLMELSIVYPI